MTRYRLDPSTRLAATSDLLIGGSPLRLFRLTRGGRERYLAIAAGADMTPTPLIDRLVDSGAIHPIPEISALRLADTTVVIPTRSPDTDRLRLLTAACRHAAAVIVVDDASPIPVTAIDGATVLRLDVNQGPAGARNAGAERATTTFVAFIDDDVVVADTGWLPLVLGHFDDETIVAVAPRVRSPAGTSVRSSFEHRHSPLDLGTLPGIVGPGRRVGYVPGAALVVRRDAFLDAGGFDTALRFGEDVDLVWRFVDLGHRCRYEPTAEVSHVARPSWRAWARQRFDYGTSAAPLAARHVGALAPVRTTAWSAAIWVLLSLKRPAPALGLAAFTTLALHRRVPGLGARESIRLAGLGHLHAGRLFAGAVRRAWWPVVVVGAVRSRWCRRLVGLAIVSSIADRGRTPGDIVLGLADDVCYGAGVWKNVIALREPDPLLPDIISWP